VITTSRQTPVYNIAGVAVAAANTYYGTHAGIIFDDGIRKRLLHLRWQYDLALEDVSDDWGWVEIEVPPQLGGVVSTVCRGVWKNYGSLRNATVQGLPFAINFLAGIDLGGFVQPYASGWGFTCATMVLAIFDGAHIELIDKLTWYVRAEDTEWQAAIIESLRRCGADPNFIAIQERDLGHIFRYRPEDVVAAGTRAPNRPSTLPQIAQLSDEARAEIQALPFIGRGYP
jgi:hypothetical protein